MRTCCSTVTLLLTLATPVAMHAQSADSTRPVVADSVYPAAVDSNAALNLFLDCRAPGCDFNYLRTELTWVNYVRDRTVAQVHVIATALGTGSGGLEVKLAFIGEKQFIGVDNEVKYNTERGASGDELRREFTRVLKLGLVQYMLATPFGRHLAVAYNAPANAARAQHDHDPWNFWVFSIGANGGISGQSASNGRSASGSLYASRTTAEWKFRANANGSTSRNSYQLDDTTNYIALSHSYSGGAVLVRSVNDHLSFGGGFGINSSTTTNLDLALRVAPTVEYDFFKYDQYTRKRLVLSYSTGLDRYLYTDTTIYNQIRETRLDNQLSLAYATTQPWGGANAGISGSMYLSNTSENHLSAYTGLSVRVARGLNLSYSFSYSRVRDQISLAKAAASDAEILLQLRQLATSYTYGGSFSLSYTFGSLFNNVVNPRFGF
jgi:hypothetical protein